jgi:hypothetical protein
MPLHRILREIERSVGVLRDRAAHLAEIGELRRGNGVVLEEDAAGRLWIAFDPRAEENAQRVVIDLVKYRRRDKLPRGRDPAGRFGRPGNIHPLRRRRRIQEVKDRHPRDLPLLVFVQRPFVALIHRVTHALHDPQRRLVCVELLGVIAHDLRLIDKRPRDERSVGSFARLLREAESAEHGRQSDDEEGQRASESWKRRSIRMGHGSGRKCSLTGRPHSMIIWK